MKSKIARLEALERSAMPPIDLVVGFITPIGDGSYTVTYDLQEKGKHLKRCRKILPSLKAAERYVNKIRSEYRYGGKATFIIEGPLE